MPYRNMTLDELARHIGMDAREVRRLADRGILVNAIAPGFVDTPMSTKDDGQSELDTEWFRENYVLGHHLPLRRAARPEEVAGPALFLAGPDATYITGATLYVDGGILCTF